MTPVPSVEPGRQGLWRRFIRPLIADMLLLSTTLLVALLLAEVMVRVFAPQQLIKVRPDIWEPVDSVGWAMRPNIATTINTGDRTVHLYTDSNGLRVVASGRHDAPTRVLIIGDSFMEADQVEYEQSLAGLLEARLPERIGRPVSVWNAGVDGWDPWQYAVRARQLLDRQHFNAMVVSVYLGNDVVRKRVSYIPPRPVTVTHHLRMPRNLRSAELIDALIAPVNDFLKTRSQAFILLRLRSHTFLTRLGLSGEYFPEELRKTEAASTRWDVTADILHDIAEAARAHGVPVTYVLIPAPFAIDSATFDEARRGFGLRREDVDLDQPTRLIEAALDRRNMPAVDVLPAFREAAAKGVQLYGHYDRHLTPAGHDLVASLVLPRVAAELDGASIRVAKKSRNPVKIMASKPTVRTLSRSNNP